MTGTQFRIEANHFVAGGTLSRWGRVTVPLAPIIYYMRDWGSERLIAYCDRKGWKLIIHES